MIVMRILNLKKGTIVWFGTHKAKILGPYVLDDNQYSIEMLDGPYRGKQISARSDLVRPV